MYGWYCIGIVTAYFCITTTIILKLLSADEIAKQYNSQNKNVCVVYGLHVLYRLLYCWLLIHILLISYFRFGNLLRVRLIGRRWLIARLKMRSSFIRGTYARNLGHLVWVCTTLAPFRVQRCLILCKCTCLLFMTFTEPILQNTNDDQTQNVYLDDQHFE